MFPHRVNQNVPRRAGEDQTIHHRSASATQTKQTMKNKLNKGFTLIELLVVITIIAILASLAVPVFSKIQEKANQTKGINNARQITLALKLYAADNNGVYPDGNAADVTAAAATVSNAVYDSLLQQGIVTSEAIFGCPNSAFNPDGDLATPLTGAMNSVHWGMAQLASDSTNGGSAIVFESPAGGGAGMGSCTWGPPGAIIQGRSWSGPRIIIGTNDGAVQTYALLPTYMINVASNPDPMVIATPPVPGGAASTPQPVAWMSGM